METLDQIGLRHGTDKASPHGYCEIYERYFAPLRDKEIALLEVGVQFGFSIQMWADYFDKGYIFGVDVANDYWTDNPHVFLARGDAGNHAFMAELFAGNSFDIIIDDGPHRADQQKTTFDALWPRLNEGGYYVIEDVFTHWDAAFNSAIAGRAWLDDLYGTLNKRGEVYYGKPTPCPHTETTLERELEFIHLYYGMIIMKKRA